MRSRAILFASTVALLAGTGVARANLGDVVVGPIAGSLYLDSQLIDYRWDTKAQALWGVAGTTKLGPFGTGLRVWRASTSQDTGIPGEDVVPQVRVTVTEAVGEYRFLEAAGFRFLVAGTIGVLHLGYSPDQIAVETPGGGAPIEISFDPITEWTAGTGMSVRRTLFRGLELGVGVDRSWFRLDTAHRVGDEIVNDRETFGNWTARVELSHRILRL